MTGVQGAARPTICLFVGPSVPAAEIRSALAPVDAELTLLPPAEQGDILRLLEQLPDVIGIVDGQFFHAPAVLHREILLAHERGARVLGAASIGALRAAELDVYGMEGVGEIYRLYRAGRIDGDDEVAVLHASASEGYRPLTEALVSVRANLGRARRRGVISPRTAAAAVAATKRLHFTRRTYGAVLAAVPDGERSALAAFLEREAVDLKRADALLLARTIADRIAGRAPWPARTPVRVNQTSHFHGYRRQYVGRQTEAGHVSDDLVLAFERLLSPSFPELYGQVSNRCLAVDEARHRGLSTADPATLVARFREARHLESDDSLAAWLQDRLMSRDELVQALGERELEAQLLAQYRARSPGSPSLPALRRLIAQDVVARIGIPERMLTRPLLMYPGLPWSGPLMRELKLLGTFRSAVDAASRILRHNAAIFERHPELARAPVRRDLLIGLVVDRWGAHPDRIESAIRARGFTGYEELEAAARHVFVYEHTSAGPYQPELLTHWFRADPDE
jgi:hypothetical protein